jgi:hypothetical protein
VAKEHARIGLNTANDIGDLTVGASLAQAGYTLGDIKQVIPAGGFPELLKLLPAGRRTRPGCRSRSAKSPSSRSAQCRSPTSTRVRLRQPA